MLSTNCLRCGWCRAKAIYRCEYLSTLYSTPITVVTYWCDECREEVKDRGVWTRIQTNTKKAPK